LGELCITHKAALVGKRVLELGCGPGISGIVCAKLGVVHSVVLTDYVSSVLELTRRNVEANGCGDVATVSPLDWMHPDATIGCDGSVGQVPLHLIRRALPKRMAGFLFSVLPLISIRLVH
jgi:predicted nicotinamide N-methyase